MSDIEWREAETSGSGDNFGGYVAGNKLFDLYDGREFTLIFFKTREYLPTLEAAKLKAESLLAEWDKKRNMMVVPEFCEKCGDSGLFKRIVDGKLHRKCDCTTNPNAWVNVKQTIGGKG